MITNAVSIRFLEVPQVLAPSDIYNRSPNTPHPNSKQPSRSSFNSGTTSIKEVEKPSENGKNKN